MKLLSRKCNYHILNVLADLQCNNWSQIASAWKRLLKSKSIYMLNESVDHFNVKKGLVSESRRWRGDANNKQTIACIAFQTTNSMWTRKLELVVFGMLTLNDFEKLITIPYSLSNQLINWWLIESSYGSKFLTLHLQQLWSLPMDKSLMIQLKLKP